MRLALLLFAVHFFIAGTLGVPPANQHPAFGFPERCTKILEAVILAAQVYDIAHTQNHLARFPYSRETDWWTAAFAGRSGRNIAGIAFGIALLDVIKWRLTTRSQTLRCAVEAEQLDTTIHAIGATQ